MKKTIGLLVATAFLLLTSCNKSPLSVRFVNNICAEIYVASDGEAVVMFPIEDRAGESMVRLYRRSEPQDVGQYVRLAVNHIDYYVPFRLPPSHKLIVDGCSFESCCWDKLALGSADEIVVNHLPVLHFEPPYGWINDPNGMVWCDGEYHLFYQWNPYGAKWQNMSWGHAVSNDLVHWQHLDAVLFPDSLGAIFSGSAVVDSDNTSGFGKGAIIAIYTSAGERQAQSIAYSTDRGRTFTKYSANPVLSSVRTDFRDPKVFWYEPTKKWIMVVAAGGAIELYSSPNLKEWSFESRFGEGIGCHNGVWECPDLIELPYRSASRWVLLTSLDSGGDVGSATQYFIGRFDGNKFTPDDTEVRWIDYGRDNYAAVTWANAPQERKILLGWQNNWRYANDLPQNATRGRMTSPRELSLGDYNGRITLFAKPVREIQSAAQPTVINSLGEIDTDLPYIFDFSVCNDDAERVEIKLSNRFDQHLTLCFDFSQNTFSVDRERSGNCGFNDDFASTTVAQLPHKNCYRLELIVDALSVECFVDGGAVAMTQLVFPSEPYDRIEHVAFGGEATIKEISVNKVK